MGSFCRISFNFSFLKQIFVYCFVINVVINLVDGHDGSAAIKYDAESFNDAVDSKSQFVMFFAPWCYSSQFAQLFIVNVGENHVYLSCVIGQIAGNDTWCGHCKRLAPTWEQLAEKYNSVDAKEVTVAKVDCTVETSFCSDHDITGYPTLKFFKPKEKSGARYRGNRDLDSLEKFISEQLEEKAKPEIPQDEVVSSLAELTEENFKTFVDEGDHFVKFYAPWCGHCQKLAPVWEQLAESLKFDPSVKISKVDCTAHRPICQDFEVKGYPTLLWLRNGKMLEKYQGSRTHEDLKEFVVKMKQHVVESEDKENDVDGKIPEKDESSVVPLTFENFKNGIAAGVTFVKFYAPWCGHCKRMAPTWEELGMKFFTNPNVKVAKVDCTIETNKDLCKENEVEGYPTLILFKNGKKQSEYTGSRDLSALHSFVMNHINRDEL